MIYYRSCNLLFLSGGTPSSCPWFPSWRLGWVGWFWNDVFTFIPLRGCDFILVLAIFLFYRSLIRFSPNTQKLFVAASPNVQENFKLQLFDERKLKLVDGIWNIKACTGNKYLKEINPMNMKGLT